MPSLGFLLCSVTLVQYIIPMVETSVDVQCPKGCSCSAHHHHISCTNISLVNIPTQLPGITSQLRLSSEHLPVIPANAFLNLSGLTTLYLNNNNISRLKPGAFNGLGQLEFLHLNNNSIEVLEFGVFENVITLAFLHLENNLLTNIMPGAFSSLIKLNVLDLSNNRLTTLGNLTFRKLSALRWLFLSNNQITTISPMAFTKNRVLRKLHLDNNQLTAVPIRALSPLKRLEILQLSNNNISSLTSVTFELKLKFLSQLYLDNMLLDEIPSQVFSRFRKLEILSMRNNRLVTLSYTKFFKSIKQFGLSGNAWRCDCELSWLREWLLKQRAADQREVMCNSPSPHSGTLLVNVQPQFLTCPPYSFEVTTTPSQMARNKTSTPSGLPFPQVTAQAFPPKVNSKQTTMRTNTIEKAFSIIPDPCLSNRIKEVTVSEVTTNSLLVNWDVLKDMGDEYEVRYSTITQVQRFHMIGGVREVELSELNAGTVYKICVIPQSRNINKCHQPASNQCLEAYTLGQPSNTVQSGDKNAQYALVGGITVMVALLIPIALIAAFKLKSRRIDFQRHFDEDGSTHFEHFETDQSKVDFDHINSAFEDVIDESNVYLPRLIQGPKIEGDYTLDCYIAPEAELGATLKCTSLSNIIL